MGSFLVRRRLSLALSVAAILGATASQARADEPAADTSSGAAAGGNANVAPPAATVTEEKVTDVLEQKGQSYYFLGVNYRGTIVPKFMVNMFVDEGATFYTNTVGLSFDYRKDHFSIIPGLNFTDMSFGNVLFLQKGKADTDPGNWGVVHSDLHAIYLTVDLLWSVPIAKSGAVDFEFGFAVGLGGVFGDLWNTWVTNDPSIGGAAIPSATYNRNYYQCTQTPGANGIAPGDGTLQTGCNIQNHTNAQISKTGPGNGYREPNWFDGGSVPVVFPWLELPIIGFRFKPIKEFEARVNGGFSVTGFFFNVALYYGFENPKQSPH